MTHYAADTHAIIWYLTSSNRLGVLARQAFQEADAGQVRIYLSAISLIEMVLLTERGKVPSSVLPETRQRLAVPGGSYVLVPVENSVATAFQGISRASIPEMPDRIITATAMSLSVPLLTCDHAIVNAGVVPATW